MCGARRAAPTSPFGVSGWWLVKNEVVQPAVLGEEPLRHSQPSLAVLKGDGHDALGEVLVDRADLTVEDLGAEGADFPRLCGVVRDTHEGQVDGRGQLAVLERLLTSRLTVGTPKFTVGFLLLPVGIGLAFGEGGVGGGCPRAVRTEVATHHPRNGRAVGDEVCPSLGGAEDGDGGGGDRGGGGSGGSHSVWGFGYSTNIGNLPGTAGFLAQAG